MQLIESAQESISIVRQCELLGISQSSNYYKPRINEFDLELMVKIDEIYTRNPFCVSALQAALKMGKLEIFNTDQGT